MSEPLRNTEDRGHSFWSDNFDMDLPKVFPEAREIMGPLGDVELVTLGRPDPNNGRLNHPVVWNGDGGLGAFLGFDGPCKPTCMVAPGATLVTCTVWEAFRDAWAHNYLMHIEGEPVWDTSRLWPLFEQIMWKMRGWGDGTCDDTKSRLVALKSYRKGVDRARALAMACGKVAA